MVTARVAASAPKPLGLTRRGRRPTDSGSLADLGEQLGRPLYPWQRQVADVALERGRWRWRFPLVTVCVPRQSGKTTLLALVALHRCMTMPDAQVWYTAQSRMDAILRWREIVRLLRRRELVELPPRHRTDLASGWDFKVWNTAGYEAIEFPNGSNLRVFAPAEDSLHGSVTDLVILDEARFFDQARGQALMAAALPTQATRDGQVWIASTAGGPGSVFLAQQLEAGRAALSSPRARRAHAEWGIGDQADVDAGDVLEAVWRSHPSAGLPGGLRRDALAVAADSMPAWQFAHEFGNRWRGVDDDRLLPASAWERSVAGDPIPEDGVPSFGVDVASDRGEAVIVACVGGVCQLVDRRPFAGWVGPRLMELADRWPASSFAVDAGGPAGGLVDQVRPVLGDRLVAASFRDLSAACGGFFDALLTDPPQVWHRPSDSLDDAARVAARRTSGRAWIFDRGRSGAALLAMVLAWWADARAPAPTVPRPRIFI